MMKMDLNIYQNWHCSVGRDYMFHFESSLNGTSNENQGALKPLGRFNP